MGTQLAQLRKKNGYSQEMLAEELGFSRQAISKWERGESVPDTDTLIILSRLYGVSLDELVGKEEIDYNKDNNKNDKENKVIYEAIERKEEQKESREAKEDEENSDSTQTGEKDAPLYPGLSSKLLKFPFPVVVVALYLLFGFAFSLWHPMWLLFLLIPAYYHFAIGAKAKTKRGFLLGLPVLEIAVMLFIITGLLFNAWKYMWILFVFVLLYYWYVGMNMKKEEGNKQKK